MLDPKSDGGVEVELRLKKFMPFSDMFDEPMVLEKVDADKAA